MRQFMCSSPGCLKRFGAELTPRRLGLVDCFFSLKQRATQSWGVQKLCQAETDAAECEAATEARQMGLFMVVTGFSCNNTYCTV